MHKYLSVVRVDNIIIPIRDNYINMRLSNIAVCKILFNIFGTIILLKRDTNINTAMIYIYIFPL